MKIRSPGEKVLVFSDIGQPPLPASAGSVLRHFVGRLFRGLRNVFGDLGPVFDGLAGEDSCAARDGGSFSHAYPIPERAPFQDAGSGSYVARAHDQGAVQLGLLAYGRL